MTEGLGDGQSTELSPGPRVCSGWGRWGVAAEEGGAGGLSRWGDGRGCCRRGGEEREEEKSPYKVAGIRDRGL